MFDFILQHIRHRYQLPKPFTLQDLQASRVTDPVSIEEFQRADASPFDHPSELSGLAGQLEGEPFLKWWQYFEAYSRELAPIAKSTAQSDDGSKRDLRVLEIGVWRGGSLELWRDYFGPNAVIFGIDIDPESAQFDGRHAHIRIGSQTDEAFLQSVVDEMGGLDVVIDDGSHVSSDVIATLRILWPRLSEGGLYFIEDLHTSYWPAWGGGLHRRGSSVEALKSLIDVLHQPYFKADADINGLGLRRDELFSVSFYDSVAVLHKGRSPMPRPFLGGRDRS